MSEEKYLTGLFLLYSCHFLALWGLDNKQHVYPYTLQFPYSHWNMDAYLGFWEQHLSYEPSSEGCSRSVQAILFWTAPKLEITTERQKNLWSGLCKIVLVLAKPFSWHPKLASSIQLCPWNVKCSGWAFCWLYRWESVEQSPFAPRKKQARESYVRHKQTSTLK